MVLVTCPASCSALMGECKQGRNEVRWRPGQEASLAPPCSNLRSFGSKSTVLKKVLATLLGLFGPPTAVSRRPGNYVPLPALVMPVGARVRLTRVLPLTRHQRNIHCESGRVVNGASKRRQAPTQGLGP